MNHMKKETIVEWSVINEEQVVEDKWVWLLQEIEKKELSTGDSSTSAVREKLEEKWYDLDKLLEMAIDVANKAVTKDLVPDYWKRLKATELLLEAAWYIKKWKWVELKFSLSKLIYDT